MGSKEGLDSSKTVDGLGMLYLYKNALCHIY